MTGRAIFDKIEISLVRTFHTLVSERSVSRAALRLSSSQPAVSAQLRRLRGLLKDPLLVRSGQGMAPTDVALRLLEPAGALLAQADALFGGTALPGFEPTRSELEFRVAASDYLDPCFLPALVARLQQEAPGVRLTVLPLSAEFDYRRALAQGDVDLVIGNWARPPQELHLGRLLSDEVACLVAADHPAVRQARTWTLERYLAEAHVAPTPLHPGAIGVIDEQLAERGLHRRITVRTPHFNLAPSMVAQTRLVLTTGRLFCARYVGVLPVRIVRCPASLPSLSYYQLWHDLRHRSDAQRWLRETVRDVARSLPDLALPGRQPTPRVDAVARSVAS